MTRPEPYIESTFGITADYPFTGGVSTVGDLSLLKMVQKSIYFAIGAFQ